MGSVGRPHRSVLGFVSGFGRLASATPRHEVHFQNLRNRLPVQLGLGRGLQLQLDGGSTVLRAKGFGTRELGFCLLWGWAVQSSRQSCHTVAAVTLLLLSILAITYLWSKAGRLNSRSLVETVLQIIEIIGYLCDFDSRTYWNSLEDAGRRAHIKLLL